MNFLRSIRGPYVCFRPLGEFNAGQIVQLKTAISDDLGNGRSFLALDLRKLTSIDTTGLRFLKNLDQALKKEKRQFVLFGGDESIREKIENDNPKQYQIFPSLEEFEYSFHDVDRMTYHNYFELAVGTESVRTLKLRCPICGNEHIKGFVLNLEDYEFEWVDQWITPIWSNQNPNAERIDVEMYRVAVCNECLFASTRIDWFDILLPEGIVDSILTADQIDRIGNKITNRKDLALDNPSIRSNTFFGFPRERRAAFMSWKLNEMTCRDVGKDKASTDGFDIAFSNLMMCKYTEDERHINEQLDTALAWLHGVLGAQERYSTSRGIQAYTYIASVYLARGKMSEAVKFQNEMAKRHSNEDEFDFWYNRVKEIIQEERES